TKPSEPPQKDKDPRRVAAGKRLAAISQQAKANKKAKREEELKNQVSVESEECEDEGLFSLKKLDLISTIVVGFGTLYFMWQSQKKDEEEEKSPVKKEEVPTKENSTRVPFDDLFD
ncbi:Hypothetical predicted protein, partial [Paramuricea clavata]